MTATDITGDEFDALFDRFVESPTSTTVTRWEAVQECDVDQEDPSLHAWRTGGPRPDRSVRTDPWLARMALSVILGGKEWKRAAFIPDPPGWYKQWETESYREAQAAGDQTFVTTVPLARWHTDFWLFQGADPRDRYAVLIHYDDAGAPVRFEYTDDPNRLRDLHAVVAEAMANAQPLNEYLSRHAVAGAH